MIRLALCSALVGPGRRGQGGRGRRLVVRGAEHQGRRGRPRRARASSGRVLVVLGPEDGIRRPLLRQPARASRPSRAPSSTPTTCSSSDWVVFTDATLPGRDHRRTGQGHGRRTKARRAPAGQGRRTGPPSDRARRRRRWSRTAPRRDGTDEAEGSDAVKRRRAGPDPSRRVGEVLRPHGRRRLRLRGGPRRHQDRRPPRRRAGLRRAGEQRQHPQPQGQDARATARPTPSGTRPDTKRAIVTLAAGDTIDLFEKS